MLVGGIPVAVFGDRLEVARASKLLGAEAFGHLACELRDATLLGCLDEDSLNAERPQVSWRRLGRVRDPTPSTCHNVNCAETPAAGSRDMAAAWASALSPLSPSSKAAAGPAPGLVLLSREGGSARWRNPPKSFHQADGCSRFAQSPPCACQAMPCAGAGLPRPGPGRAGSRHM
jgi:hypothetical protein